MTDAAMYIVETFDEHFLASLLLAGYELHQEGAAWLSTDCLEAIGCAASVSDRGIIDDSKLSQAFVEEMLPDVELGSLRLTRHLMSVSQLNQGIKLDLDTDRVSVESLGYHRIPGVWHLFLSRQSDRSFQCFRGTFITRA